MSSMSPRAPARVLTWCCPPQCVAATQSKSPYSHKDTVTADEHRDIIHAYTQVSQGIYTHTSNIGLTNSQQSRVYESGHAPMCPALWKRVCLCLTASFQRALTCMLRADYCAETVNTLTRPPFSAV
ncbi:TPA: hypothetical protein ACH3X2_003673 [Trebouxia sp. C0005]